MNSASQDFPRHLAQLRERMLHPTDYEKAVHYFLEKFAGDQAFVSKAPQAVIDEMRERIATGDAAIVKLKEALARIA